MKVLMLAVAYNSYASLEKFIESIASAYALVSDMEICVMVADNTEKDRRQEIVFQPDFDFKMIRTGQNLGYFGGVKFLMDYIGKDKVDTYDYVSISNVDLTLSSDFFIELSKTNLPDAAWLASSILSKVENRDKNPKIKKRYSLDRLKKLRMLYKYPVLDWIYTHTLYLRKRSVAKEKPFTEIYAGHGAFIILTQSFVRQWNDYSYPVFLFGEEIFLAEEIAKTGLKVVYVPSIKIYDSEHVSTGSIRRAAYYRYNLESIDYVIKTYYK